MPCSGRFMGESGYVHTHGEIDNEVWILNKQADLLLPETLKNADLSRVADLGFGGDRFNTGVAPLPVALSEYNTSLVFVKGYIRTLHPSSIRCMYKSNQIQVGASLVDRGPLSSMHNVETCSNWKFDAKDAVTLMGFNAPWKNQGRDFSMHQHWHPLVSFDSTCDTA